MNRVRNSKYFVAAVVALLTFAVYLPALQNGFVEWDDGLYVYENTHIRSFDLAFLKWAFFDFYGSNWHPLTWVSHAVDYALWGLDPRGHHLSSILLHALNTFLLVALVFRLITLSSAALRKEAVNGDTNRFGLIAAAVTGALFGLHPLHVESVAWVAERKDLLCGLFFLLSISAYAEYAAGIQQTGGFSRSPRTGRHNYLFALGFFGLALLSKPMAVTLPLVLLILDWHPFGLAESRAGLRASLFEKIPFFALSLASSCLTILAQQGGGAVASVEAIPLPVRIVVAVKSLADYLTRMLIPADLLPFYPYPDAAAVSAADPRYLIPLVLMAGVTVFCILAARRQKLWLAAWVYFIVTLIPVLGLVQVGSQASADRYTYLPGVGPFLIMGAAAARAGEISGMLKRPVTGRALFGWTAAVLLTAALGFATVRQISIWENTFVLWTTVIKKSPGTIHAYLNRGLAFKRKGMLDDAVRDYRTAISINSSSFIAHYNLGNIYLQQGRTDDAITEYRTTLALRPDYAECRNNLGVAYEDQGRIDPAIEQYRAALQLKPGYAEAHYNLGYAYARKGDRQNALEQFTRAVELDPGNPEFRRELDQLRNGTQPATLRGNRAG